MKKEIKAMDEKIRSHHLARKAMLYVRQSSQNQVIRNQESRLLQYGMEKRLRELGWTDIEIVDEDLGRSAAGGEFRSGFERMVSEVCLKKVGAVAAREVSRFARNSREWQQLVEVCRMVDTLLIDHETTYDARRSNDRLLLGLKGSLNEYELDLLRLRSLEARREKASRGELIIRPPVGYIKTDDGLLVKDPDRRIQELVHLIFQKFLQLGAVRQVLFWFVEQGLHLPTKRYRAKVWETDWRRPSYRMILHILRDPTYAGAYAYGKTEVQVEFLDGRMHKKVKRKAIEDWYALIYDHHEGYIDRELFDRIQQMISNNLPANRSGAPKKGPALLTGLLRCHRCGRKLTVRYTGASHTVLRYDCCRGILDNAEPKCISIGGNSADEAVSGEILQVIQPAAIEAAKMVAQNKAGQQDELIRALELELQAARYEADRAWRQFDAADPANRLVADELERRWELALKKIQDLQGRIEKEQSRRQQTRPPDPTILGDLAANLDFVWNHPHTDVRIKKRILRTLIEEIIVDIEREAGEILLVIHWQGGIHTELRVHRRRSGENSLHTSPDIVEAVRVLTRICPDEIIAGVLNRNGVRTGKGNRWTKERVTSLRSKRKILKYSPEKQELEGWMNLTQAATYTGVSATSLRQAVARDEIKGFHPLPNGPWIFRREDLDSPCARSFICRVRQRRDTTTELLPGQEILFKSTT